MQYFKDKSNQVFAYDDGLSLDYINQLNPGLTRITEEEVNDITDPGGHNERLGYYYDLMSKIDAAYEQKIAGNDDYDPDTYYTRYHNVNNKATYNSNTGIQNYTNYTISERETFKTQYEEAKAFKDSGFKDLSKCRNLSILASNRGKNVVDLAQKIINKYEEKEKLKFKYLGLKQKYQDTVQAYQNDVNKLRELSSTIKDWLKFD